MTTLRASHIACGIFIALLLLTADNLDYLPRVMMAFLSSAGFFVGLMKEEDQSNEGGTP